MTKRAAVAISGAPAGGAGGGSAKVQRASDPLLDSYESYLRGVGAWWAEDKVRVRPPTEVEGAKVPSYLVHEWGIMSLGKSVKAGTQICKVPRRACFGEELPALREGEDTQMHMAVKLLKEKNQGPSSAHFHKLQTLPEAVPVCWGWPEADRALLQGTELDAVTSMKLKRLRQEYEASKDLAGVGFQEYVQACAVVISHANPWFGVSMVPFVDMGNHSDEKPHVEFRKKGENIVGTAIRNIPKLTEIYQSYGDLGNADLMYRYGFTRPSLVPTEEDKVSLDAQTLASAAGASCLKRIGMLEKSCLIDSSPWDGLESVKTVEISLAEGSQAQGCLRVDGLPELLVCMYLLMLPEPRWRDVIRLGTIATLALSSEVHSDDIGAVSLFVGMEAVENSTAGPEAQPAQSDQEIVNQAIARLRERCKASGFNLHRQSPTAESQEESGKSDSKPEEEEEDDDDDDDVEGVEWYHLVGEDGEVPSWLRTEETLSASRTALAARAARYRTLEEWLAHEKEMLKGVPEGNGNLMMALRLRVLEMTVIREAQERLRA